ncbi:Bifunctional cytochrome P450/NADPH--P450 reductase [Talaromyces pinophilus]|nr:Bifunctional cytochrome P450/NADPH--P450 reductase [Talaromyces pinophilus]
MTSKIPQPPGVPLLGNVFDVDPSNTWGSLNKLAAKWGPIFKINALGTQIVFICNAALLEEICDETRFRKCVNGPIVEIRQAVHASLFTAYESEDEKVWGPVHRIMSPWVSDESNKITFNDQRDSIAAIVPAWTSKPGQKVNVADGLKRLNLQSVVWSMFHQKGDWMSGPFPAFLTAIDKSTMEAVKRPTRPKLLNWLVHQRGYDKDIKTMRSFCADVIAKRKNDQETFADMLNVMLNGKDPKTGVSLDHEQVIDEIINIFIGSATSPCFVSFALYYLIKNPEYITKAREEIDSILGADGELTYDNLQQFQFCNAILRESMRLSAVAPGFNIEPRPDVNTGPYVSLAGGQYQVPSKQALIAVLGAVNRDPAVFDDPEAFRPERMLGEAYDRLPSGVKKGFGNGKRRCFGAKFAWQWSWITLVTILREVDLELADKKYTIDGDINGAFCVQPWHFVAKVEKRKDRP